MGKTGKNQEAWLRELRVALEESVQRRLRELRRAGMVHAEDYPNDEDFRLARLALAEHVIREIDKFRFTLQSGVEIGFRAAITRGQLAEGLCHIPGGALVLMPDFGTRMAQAKRGDLVAEQARREAAAYRHAAEGFEAVDPVAAQHFHEQANEAEKRRWRHAAQGRSDRRGRFPKFGAQVFGLFLEEATEWIDEDWGRLSEAGSRRRAVRKFIGTRLEPFRTRMGLLKLPGDLEAVSEALFSRGTLEHKARRLAEVVFGISKATAYRYLSQKNQQKSYLI